MGGAVDSLDNRFAVLQSQHMRMRQWVSHTSQAQAGLSAACNDSVVVRDCHFCALENVVVYKKRHF